MKFKKLIAVAAAATSLISSCFFQSYEVLAESSSAPSTSSSLTIYGRKRAYLKETQDGYMRVYIPDEKTDNNIRIEYFDKSFNLTSKKSIPREMEYWGGFYEGSDNYFTIEGQSNKEELDAKEVIRVNKYDKSWNKIGTAHITGDSNMFGGQIGYPFDYGCCEVTELNGKLYIATGHDGYVDESVGQGHQGLLLLMVDEKSMSGAVADCDLGHSFSQYIDNDGSNLYLLEESEGSEESLLTKYDPSKLPADYFDSQDTAAILKYGGERTSAWAVFTYASCNGIALSQNNVLTLGTSIDQSKYGKDDTYNIYLGVTPKNNVSTNSTSLKWLTTIPSGSVGVENTQITKINDDRFLVSWNLKNESSEYSSNSLADYNDPLSEYKFHYMFIDGNGNKISNEYIVNAAYSDCSPIYNGSDVVFYASGTTVLDFYSINASTGSFSKKVTKNLGDNVTWDYQDGVLTIQGTGAIGDLESYRWYSDSFWPNDICENTTRIIIKGGVTKISKNAFAYFSNLVEVVIEDGVKSIGEQAFYRCGNLDKILIPASVTDIGKDIVWTGSWWIGDEDDHVYDATIYTTEGSTAESYANKYNIRCSYSIEEVIGDPNVRLGDANGDQKVDSKDAVLILQKYAQFLVSNQISGISVSKADVNSDGKVDSKDAVLVLQYYAQRLAGTFTGLMEDFVK